jgi:predicted DNA-binding transcriptional regulator AlpA
LLGPVLDELRGLRAELRDLRTRVMAPPAELLDLDGLASVLSLSRKTIKNRLSAGSFPIPSHHSCGKRLFKRADVLAFVEGLNATD